MSRFGKGEIWLWNFQIVTASRRTYAPLRHHRRPLSHQKGDTMLSALVETVGALGILASVVAKIAELRKEYRRCKKVSANKKTPPKRGR